MGSDLVLYVIILLFAVGLFYGGARLGFASPQTYLIVGVLAGPFGFGLILPDMILPVGEVGVIILLFLFGLEFGLAQFRVARSRILVQGIVTYAGSVAVLFAAFWLLVGSATSAFVAALLLSFSSIALGMQAVSEKHLGATQAGRTLSSVLSFQVLLFTPVAIAVMVLQSSSTALAVPLVDVFLPTLSYPVRLLIGLGLLVAFYLVTYPLLRYLIRSSLARGYADIATGACILVILTVLAAGDSFGVPAPVLAYLAGLAFSRSDIRNTLSERLLPIKAMLLLVLFAAIGMSLDVNLLVENAGMVALFAVATMLAKFVVGWIFGWFSFRQADDRLTFALGAMPPGELTYAMLGVGLAQAGQSSLMQLYLSTVIVVMIVTPLFLIRSRRRSERTRVFLSYSRRESDIAADIADILARNDVEVLIDTRDLPFGEIWREELDRFIRQADSVVWLVSPASIESTWCKWEVERVTHYGKRLIPIIAKPTDLASLPATIGKVQVLPRVGVFDKSDRRHRNDLVESLQRDNSWLKMQTRLIERARDWERAGRGSERLLRGGELSEASDWLSRRPPGQAEMPSLLLDFIETSHAATV